MANLPIYTSLASDMTTQEISLGIPLATMMADLVILTFLSRIMSLTASDVNLMRASCPGLSRRNSLKHMVILSAAKTENHSDNIPLTSVKLNEAYLHRKLLYPTSPPPNGTKFFKGKQHALT